MPVYDGQYRQINYHKTILVFNSCAILRLLKAKSYKKVTQKKLQLFIIILIDKAKKLILFKEVKLNRHKLVGYLFQSIE